MDYQDESALKAGLGSKRFTRRAALGAAVATGISAGWGKALAQTPGAEPSAPPIDLPQPEVIAGQGGLLDLTLTCTPATVDMNAPRSVSTYTYDGIVPGRTWEILPGDTIRVNLVNDLPPLAHHEHPVDMLRPHEWTTTNIHTHGLHVSPEGNGDNPFLAIPPGESFQYEIPVPDDHTGGMFWYHPHRHGAVTQQLRAGMAGVIIVRGEIDEVDEIRAAKEQMMVIQAIELGDDYQLLDPIPHPTKEQAFFPRTQILYTVNGVINPTIKMYPGEVQRWRILNAAEGKFMSLQLEEHLMNVIAWDGLTLRAPEAQSDVMLSAANRAEVLVKAGSPGIYELSLTPGSSQHPGIPGMVHAIIDPENLSSAELKPRTILTVEVVGSSPEMDLPDLLPAWDPPILPIARTRILTYSVQREPNNEFISFGVNGRPFDPDEEPYRMKLGTAEEWTLINGIDNKLPHHAHAFHIHVNPFKVTRINGRTLDRPLWRDTFALSGQTGDSFTFEMNLDDFTGKFVHHCHVISHEDLGMMESLEIVE
jgi:FtsP/CotA-like multicopper oxidase with cupredoxin domain